MVAQRAIAVEFVGRGFVKVPPGRLRHLIGQQTTACKGKMVLTESIGGP